MTNKFEKYGVKISKWVLTVFGVYMLFKIFGGYVLLVILLIIWQTIKK